ncbi:MAG: hypothetical protein ABW185_13850 [Sedimenticola sp.]
MGRLYIFYFPELFYQPKVCVFGAWYKVNDRLFGSRDGFFDLSFPFFSLFQSFFGGWGDYSLPDGFKNIEDLLLSGFQILSIFLGSGAVCLGQTVELGDIEE